MPNLMNGSMPGQMQTDPADKIKTGINATSVIQINLFFFIAFFFGQR